MSSRKDDDDLEDTQRPVFMTAIFVLGVIATIILMLFTMFQFIGSAFSHSQGSMFDMMCGFFAPMGMIAFIWIVIFIAMFLTGSSSRKRRRPPRFFDWQI